jgi:hypothetical protein
MDDEVKSQAEGLKNDAKDAASKVKETFKNVNVKEDAKETKNFIGGFLKDPIEALKESANSSGKFFKVALMILIAYAALQFLNEFILNIKLEIFEDEFGKAIKNVFFAILEPVLMIATFSVIIKVVIGDKSKNIVEIIETVVLAHIFQILAYVITFLNLLSSQASVITSKFTSFANYITYVLLFFAVKFLSGKEDNKDAFKKFMIVMAVYIVARWIISYLGIYI